MIQLFLPDEAPASTPEPPQAPPAGDKDRPRDRKRPPEPDDEAPETPPTDPIPVPVQDPPSEPRHAGPTWCNPPMPSITTRDGVPLYVKDWGRAAPSPAARLAPVGRHLRPPRMAIAGAGMRAIAYDRRGFGRSGQPWGGYDYDTLATDLADVIEQKDARGAALVGFSMGGGEVVRYLSRFPDHTVTQAVLIGSVVPYMLQTPDNPKGVPQAVFDQMAQGIAEDRAKFWAGFFPQFYGSGLLRQTVSHEVIEWSRQVAMQASLKATLGCARAFSTTDFRPI